MKNLILFTSLISLITIASHSTPRLLGHYDFHVHLFNSEGVSALLESMDSSGVEKSAILSWAYGTKTEAESRLANNFVAEQALKYPSRLSGICSVPIKAKWYYREATRCFKDLRLKGLKLHFGQEQFNPVKDRELRRFENLAGLSAKYQVPILVHIASYDAEGIRPILRVALKYREAKFVIAHAFTTNYRELLNVARYLDQPGVTKNVYLETSTLFETYAGSPEMDDVVWYLRKFGIDYVLWGSDWSDRGPLQDESLNSVKLYSFTKEERAKILRENALKLLK